MNTVKKGNELEDKFYQYLLDQQSRGDFVYGAYPPKFCKIHKKRKYYCKMREADVEFDIVIELYREGRSSPHLIVVFECKNHGSAIQEREINDFSAKLGRLFKHGAKGVVVVSSPLQSGADKVARNSKMGIVKYNEHGFEIIADRKSGTCAENRFVESQIFKKATPVKPLKFSAYHDGSFFGSIDQFLESFCSSLSVGGEFTNDKTGVSIPFIPDEEIQQSAQSTLKKIDYQTGQVELTNLCSVLSIDLQFTDQAIQDEDGNFILGSENFDRKSILVNSHDNKQRERFTIAHEIGHICLQHDRYLRSESIIERDLQVNSANESSFNCERLEFQANAFASHLLLPANAFCQKTAELRKTYDFKDKGHGYIFVDDQPCNYAPYNNLLSDLSFYFDVSKQAIEIKFKKMRMLTDKRKRLESLSTPKFVANSVSFP